MVGGAWAMMAMGIHCVDLLRFLLGQEVVEVAAITDGQSQESPLERLATMCLRFNADFRSRKLTHNGQGQGYSKITGRLCIHGIGRFSLSRVASRRIGLCVRLSKRTTRRSACT